MSDATGPDHDTDSAVRQRTRRTILEAAVTVWARDFSAALGTIAERAGVSRSTLHRYFPDRQGLQDAAVTDALARLGSELAQAVSHCSGGAADELEALMRASIRMGDAITFLWSDLTRFADHPQWSTTTYDDADFDALLRRAVEEGVLRADMDTAWLTGVYYALVWTAAEAIENGTLPPHTAADLAVRTFFNGAGG